MVTNQQLDLRLVSLAKSQLADRYWIDLENVKHEGHAWQGSLVGVLFYSAYSDVSVRVISAKGKNIGISLDWQLSLGVFQEYSNIEHAEHARFNLEFKSFPNDFPLRVEVSSDGENWSLFSIVVNTASSLDLSEEVSVSAVTYENSQSVFICNNIHDSIQAVHHHEGRFYEEDILQFLLGYIPKYGIVCDVGANIGNHTVFLAKHSRAKQIIVFEPYKKSYDQLFANLRLNSIDCVDCRYLGFAVGSNQSLSYAIRDKFPNNLGGAFLEKDKNGLTPTLTLDDLILQDRVALLKIDVEGMELDVLQGAVQLISSHRPVIFIEVRKDSYNEAVTFLNDQGYRLEKTFWYYYDIVNLLFVSKSILD